VPAVRSVAVIINVLLLLCSCTGMFCNSHCKIITYLYSIKLHAYSFACTYLFKIMLFVFAVRMGILTILTD